MELENVSTYKLTLTHAELKIIIDSLDYAAGEYTGVDARGDAADLYEAIRNKLSETI